MKELSIIIVNFNSKEFILSCIESIKKHSVEKIRRGEWEIIVIDNASSDGSPKTLIEISDITFIPSVKNLGFSKANNLGVKKATGRYLLFLNPDTIVYQDTLEKMIEFMNSHIDAGAATCRLVLPNGRIDDASHRGFPTPWNSLTHFSGISKLFPKSRLFNGYNLGWRDLDKNHEIDVLAGAFMLVRRDAGEEVGWWDEDYFFYGEDIEFCFSLKQKGWKVYYVAGTSAFHHKGVTGGIKSISKKITTADINTRINATKWRYKAMNIFYDKHYVNKYPFFLSALVKLAIQLKLWTSLRKIGKKINVNRN